MTKEQLKRIKAGLLAGILCISLSACANSETNKNEKESNKSNQEQQEQIEDTQYLIAFLEGKAYIYQETTKSQIIINVEVGYAKIKNQKYYTHFLETPTIILFGKENALTFASSVVGEENVIFMSYSETEENKLVMTPNN